MYANGMRDNASKNMLWATYDGKTWIPTVYDQDGTFGQVWDGVRFEDAHRPLPTVTGGKINVNIEYGPSDPAEGEPRYILWDKLWNNFAEEILDRYYELRRTVLSTDNIIAELRAFESSVPASVYEADAAVWGASRNSWWTSKNGLAHTGSATWDYNNYHFDYMCQWVADRMNYYDIAMQKIANFIGY